MGDPPTQKPNAMKKKSSSTTGKKPKRKKRPVDKIAAEMAEVKARKIPAKYLVWMFQVTTTKDEQVEPALAACVEFLQGELGKRCRVALETFRDGRKAFHDLILKSAKLTPEMLRKVDRGLAATCKELKLKYAFVGYGEDLYETNTWKTLGTLLDTADAPQGDLDCRELRFDGLYRHGDEEDSCNYLRFYPNGEYVSVRAMGTVAEVARWLRREHKELPVGTYELRAKSFSAESEETRGEEPVVFKLKGRLTKQGLKTRTWSSYSNEEYEAAFAFYKVKLK